MTDEQWLWLFVNEAIDYDEKLGHMCPKCQSDATSNKCIRCGKPLGNDKFKPQFINPNFDAERFDRLSSGTDESSNSGSDEDIDYDLVDKILIKS